MKTILSVILADPMFWILWLLAGLLLWAPSGCATRNAGLRRQGEARLAACLTCNGLERDRCYAESEAWCRSVGLERRCADDFLFVNTPTCAN